MSKKEEILHKLNTEDRNYIKEKFKEKDLTIADLEAKIAERENQIYELQTKLNLKEYAPAFCSLAGRDCEALGKVDQLKQQLVEKDQAIEGLQEINQSLGQTCNNDAKEIERLREKLHTANQETLHFQNKYFAEKQIAIEELKNIREYVKECWSLDKLEGKVRLDIAKKIRERIEELKGEK